MSKTEAPEPPSAVILSVNAIIEGVFYRAGTPLPYQSEKDLPPNLQPFVATGQEPSLQPVMRNIYDLSPAARRQIRVHEAAAAEKAWAEQVADEPLPPETAEALQASHDIAIGRARAQLEHNQAVIDAAHAAAQPTEPRQLFVRRGGELGHAERCRLKPAELIFARTPTGEYEAVGHTNSNAEIPDEVTHDIQT